MEPDSTYLVSGALLTDEPVGPLYASCAEAQTLARAAIATVGGTARILRQGDGGWVEVARYTDTGRFSTGRDMGLGSWAVIAADEDEPDWAEVVEIHRPASDRDGHPRPTHVKAERTDILGGGQAACPGSVELR